MHNAKAILTTRRAGGLFVLQSSVFRINEKLLNGEQGPALTIGIPVFFPRRRRGFFSRITNQTYQIRQTSGPRTFYGGKKSMNTLVIVLITACCLVAGYVFYGRWLANKWGIDPKAKTPAVTKNDGQDYVPTDGWVVFAHQFSSIAGAGPVTGAIQAAVFGWVPVFLWILLGGIFFGAVTDFGALYANVKNEGRSMGLLIEQYIGKTGKEFFLLFCWLFTLIVIAAFAVVFGLIQKKMHFTGWKDRFPQ